MGGGRWGYVCHPRARSAPRALCVRDKERRGRAGSGCAAERVGEGARRRGVALSPSHPRRPAGVGQGRGACRGGIDPASPAPACPARPPPRRAARQSGASPVHTAQCTRGAGTDQHRTLRGRTTAATARRRGRRQRPGRHGGARARVRAPRGPCRPRTAVVGGGRPQAVAGHRPHDVRGAARRRRARGGRVGGRRSPGARAGAGADAAGPRPVRVLPHAPLALARVRHHGLVAAVRVLHVPGAVADRVRRPARRVRAAARRLQQARRLPEPGQHRPGLHLPAAGHPRAAVVRGGERTDPQLRRALLRARPAALVQHERHRPAGGGGTGAGRGARRGARHGAPGAARRPGLGGRRRPRPGWRRRRVPAAERAAQRVRARPQLAAAARLHHGAAPAQPDVAVLLHLGGRRRRGVHLTAALAARRPQPGGPRRHRPHPRASGGAGADPRHAVVHSRGPHPVREQEGAPELHPPPAADDVQGPGAAVAERVQPGPPRGRSVRQLGGAVGGLAVTGARHGARQQRQPVQGRQHLRGHAGGGGGGGRRAGAAHGTGRARTSTPQRDAVADLHRAEGGEAAPGRSRPRPGRGCARPRPGDGRGPRRPPRLPAHCPGRGAVSGPAAVQVRPEHDDIQLAAHAGRLGLREARGGLGGSSRRGTFKIVSELPGSVWDLFRMLSLTSCERHFIFL